MTTQLIPHSFNERTISQRADDGYVHATAMCAAGGKRLNNYLRNSVTRGFIGALAAETRIRATELVIVRQGGTPDQQGTWVHPKVALHLAQWISPTFAVQVVNWVYDWMNNRAAETRQQVLPPAPRYRRPWHPTRAEMQQINSRASALLQVHFHPVRDMIIARMKQDRENGTLRAASDYGINTLPAAANDQPGPDHATFAIDGDLITADCRPDTLGDLHPGDRVVAIRADDGSGPDIFTIAETAIPKSWFDRCHLAKPRNSRDLVRPVVVVIGTIVKEGCNEKTRMDGNRGGDHRGIDHDGV